MRRDGVGGAFGADSFTCSLALGMARKGVTLDAVCPAGYTETDMLRRSINMVARTGRNVGDERASFAAANPQGRIVQSAQVADTVRWLCPPGTGAPSPASRLRCPAGKRRENRWARMAPGQKALHPKGKQRVRIVRSEQ